MNPFNRHGANPAGWPAPIVNDQPFTPVQNGYPRDEFPREGGPYDPATGECHLEGTMDGVIYDTCESALVASIGALDAAKAYTLKRLYCAPTGHWYFTRLEWWSTIGLANQDFIQPIPPEAALLIAHAFIPDKDCRRFLLEWYCDGWILRDDVHALDWAEHSLSVEDRETVKATIAKLLPLS